MTRYLAVDLGRKRVGLAVGDDADGLATPLKTLPADPPATLPERIAEAARAYGGEVLVVGLPINMDGTVGPMAEQARAFAGTLRSRTGLGVKLVDERLSSFAADEALAGHLTRKKRRARQDAVAAAEILRTFFREGDVDGEAYNPSGP